MTAEGGPVAFLGRYRILGVIGAGAMGVVYKAHDPQIDRAVALKTIRQELLSSHGGADVVARFRREAMAAGRLAHSGIVSIYDYGEDGDTAYIVMEYAPGIALADYVGEGGRLDSDEAAALMEQLLDALAYAHAQGVVHRDIKPANLLISAKGRLKVADFGIARIETGRITETGAAVGTPLYMAPERYRGQSGDARADLFSAGVVLYELLTGSLPFGGQTMAEITYQVCFGTHEPPSRRVSGVASGFDRVLDRALAKDPAARYATARSFADEVGAAAREPVPAGARASPMAMAATQFEPARESWPLAVVQGLETGLASVFGPLTGVTVRRCANRAGSDAELTELLLRMADTPAERARVVSVVEAVTGGARKGGALPPASFRGDRSTPSAQLAQPVAAAPLAEGAPSAAAPFATTTGTPALQSGPIALRDLESLTLDLATHVGPIARVLVKRALVGATSAEELRRRLAEHISEEAERNRWLSRTPRT